MKSVVEEKKNGEIVSVFSAIPGTPAVPASQHASWSPPNELFTPTEADQNLTFRVTDGSVDTSRYIKDLWVFQAEKQGKHIITVLLPQVIPNSLDSDAWGLCQSALMTKINVK